MPGWRGFTLFSYPRDALVAEACRHLQAFNDGREPQVETFSGRLGVVKTLLPEDGPPTAAFFECGEAGQWTFCVTGWADGWPTFTGLMISQEPELRAFQFGISANGAQPGAHFEFHEHGRCVRSVISQKDGDRWTYFSTGTRQAFESPSNEARRSIGDRLNEVVLTEYSKVLGIDLTRLTPDLDIEALILRCA